MTKVKKVKPDRKNYIFNRKDLAKIILPLIFQQLLTVMVGAVDTMMVSYAGESAVSGVSLVNTLDVLLTLFFTSLVGGGTVVVAQMLGEKKYEDARMASKQLIYISTIIAIVIAAIALVLRRILLNLLFGDVEQSVMDSAESYFFIIIFSYPFMAIEGSVVALFRSSGNSLISLIVSLVMNVFNVGGNAFFIIGIGMGAAGAALSTCIVRILGACVMLGLFHRKKGVLYVEKLFHYKPNWAVIKKILRIGIPNGIENAMFHLGKVLTQSLVSSMGTASIAANAVALTICNFQYTVGTAFSNATITIVGQCIGARETEQAKYYAKLTTALNYLALWVVIALTVAFISPILTLYGLSSQSAQLAQELIMYHCVCAGLIWPIAFMLPSAFRASSDVKFQLVVSSFSMWAFRVAGSYVCALDTVSVFGLFSFPGFNMGIMGVWVAMTVDWVFRTIFFLIRFFSGVWLKKAYEQPSKKKIAKKSES